MSSEELSLTWGDHHSTLVGVFEKLLESSTLVDCTLAAEGQYLKAHRVVLSACSPYFQMLFSQENEKNPIVILKGIKFQELKFMIDFIYRGKVKIPENRLEDFIDAAESLQIKGLGAGPKTDSSETKKSESPTPRREGLRPRKRRRMSEDDNENELSPQSETPEEPTNSNNSSQQLDPADVLSISQTEIPSPIVTLTTGSDVASSDVQSDHSNSEANPTPMPVECALSPADTERLLAQAASVVKMEPEPVAEIFLDENDCLVDPKKEMCEDDMPILENDGISAVMEYVQQQQSTNQYSGPAALTAGGSASSDWRRPPKVLERRNASVSPVAAASLPCVNKSPRRSARIAQRRRATTASGDGETPLPRALELLCSASTSSREVESSHGRIQGKEYVDSDASASTPDFECSREELSQMTLRQLVSGSSTPAPHFAPDVVVSTSCVTVSIVREPQNTFSSVSEEGLHENPLCKIVRQTSPTSESTPTVTHIFAPGVVATPSVTVSVIREAQHVPISQGNIAVNDWSDEKPSKISLQPSLSGISTTTHHPPSVITPTPNDTLSVVRDSQRTATSILQKNNSLILPCRREKQSQPTLQRRVIDAPKSAQHLIPVAAKSSSSLRLPQPTVSSPTEPQGRRFSSATYANVVIGSSHHKDQQSQFKLDHRPCGTVTSIQRLVHNGKQCSELDHSTSVDDLSPGEFAFKSDASRFTVIKA